MSASYIYSEGKRLEALSLRLLELIVMKRRGLALRPVPAASLFTHLRETFPVGFTLVTDFDAAQILTERDLLDTVLVNLIDNACKASEPGGRIEARGRLVSEGYMFSVRDYGHGIPESELDKITEAFYMVDKSRSRSRNGAGIGLALSSAILEMHGSKLCFESRPGEGTRVSFVLPFDYVGYADPPRGKEKRVPYE